MSYFGELSIFDVLKMACAVGMGLHGAPLEALFGDSVESGRRSHVYVLRSALRTAGNALGPLVAVVVFCIYGRDRPEATRARDPTPRPLAGR